MGNKGKNPTVTLASGNSRNSSCSSRDDKLWQNRQKLRRMSSSFTGLWIESASG